MIKLTEIEMAQKDLIKTAKVAIRLRHSLNADHEINAVVPDAVKAFNRSIAQGKLPIPIDIMDLMRSHRATKKA